MHGNRRLYSRRIYDSDSCPYCQDKWWLLRETETGPVSRNIHGQLPPRIWMLCLIWKITVKSAEQVEAQCDHCTLTVKDDIAQWGYTVFQIRKSTATIVWILWYNVSLLFTWYLLAPQGLTEESIWRQRQDPSSYLTGQLTGRLRQDEYGDWGC